MNKSVYISYVEENIAIAKGLVQYLNHSLCWLSQFDSDPDKSLIEQKLEAISHSEFLVLIHSAHSNNSSEILKEIQHAFSNDIKIITLRIEDIKFSPELKNYLDKSHQFDVYKGSLNEYLQELEKIIIST
ncbi:MAG: toll/interleukin-1 receptor domain-containing protein [Candidatus Hodarchaeales archaeon]